MPERRAPRRTAQLLAIEGAWGDIEQRMLIDGAEREANSEAKEDVAQLSAAWKGPPTGRGNSGEAAKILLSIHNPLRRPAGG